ncbi:MAG: S8 family peptidase [archaeon]|nr:S8 family peptidase [archaeon]
MKRFTVILTILLLVFSITAAAAGNDNGNAPEKVRVFLEFNGKANPALVHAFGGNVIHQFDLLDNVLVIEVSEHSLAGLLRNPNVVGYELDAEVHTMGKSKPIPSPPPAQETPWGVSRIGADQSIQSGAGVKVCIVDTGVDKDHSDLQANIVGGKNFVAKGRSVDVNKWDDDNGHGTHVAGTIAALNNDIGVVGVAPEASLLIAKVLNSRGSGYMSDVVAGVDFCVQQGADVISMSLGTSSDVQSVHDAMDAAFANGVLLVAAAGNEYASPVIFPAAYGSVVAVSATDSNDNLASFSNVGAEVEVAAPGVGILSTWLNNGYNTISGTSMATPHVSGVAALAIQSHPGFDVNEIRTLLQTTANDLGEAGRDNSFGFGLVDALFE